MNKEVYIYTYGAAPRGTYAFNFIVKLIFYTFLYMFMCVCIFLFVLLYILRFFSYKIDRLMGGGRLRRPPLI